MPTAQNKEARLAIAALLNAASNPRLTQEQSKTLINEARKNAVLAFGPWAAEELTRIAVGQVTEFYDNSVSILYSLADLGDENGYWIDAGSEDCS
jgi:hypothetical protein